MRDRQQWTRALTAVAVTAAAALTVAVLQAQGQAPAQPPRTPKGLAPIDLTGTWVSVVTEDWRFRMVTPPKGDYASVPISNEGRRVADMWDPDKDTADGNACKSYGAPAISRVPGRIKIAWQDDNTLKAEYDAGTQTRVFHFGDTAQGANGGDWQGVSVANWEYAGGFNPNAPARGAGGGGGGGGRGGPAVPMGGSLKVVTTKFKAGYLRKNGVPYSETATLTEYYDRHSESNGDEWFTVTTIVNDPKYLNQEFITSTHFKKEANDTKFKPNACTAK